jgi:hypothetical protein
MMMRCAWVLLAAFALVGCASPVKKQAFNKEGANGLKTVAVAQLPNQDSYEAAVLAHPGINFGLIGGLIAAADISAKSNRLTGAIGSGETRLQERFASGVSTALRDVGYQTMTVALAKGLTDAQMLEAAAKGGGADALLCGEVIGSYWAAGPTTQYLPRVLAKVRLLDARSGATLFEDTFTYGYAQPTMQTIHMSADERYSFATIDALVADPQLTRQGLIDGLTAIAGQIAADLKRQ